MSIVASESSSHLCACGTSRGSTDGNLSIRSICNHPEHISILSIMFSQMCFSKQQNSWLLPEDNAHNQNWFSDNTPCCSCLYTVSPGNTDNGSCQATNAATALFHIFGLKALLAPKELQKLICPGARIETISNYK